MSEHRDNVQVCVERIHFSLHYLLSVRAIIIDHKLYVEDFVLSQPFVGNFILKKIGSMS